MKRGWGGRQDRGKDPSKRKKEKPLTCSDPLLLLSAPLAKTMGEPPLKSTPCLGYLCGSCPRRSVQTSVWVNLRRALTIPGLQWFGKSFAQNTKEAEEKKKKGTKKLVHLLQENPPSERARLFWLVGELAVLEARPLFSRRIDYPHSSDGLSLWKLLFMVWCVETINMGTSIWGWGRPGEAFPSFVWDVKMRWQL